MSNEREFAAKIEELRTLAASQGNVVTREQVEELFEELGMSSDSLGPVYDYLKAKKIGIDEAVNLDNYLTDDDKNYLEMYLEELRELPEYSDGEKEAYYISALAGHQESCNRVIEIMLPDVVDMAKLYSAQGVSMEDLIGEGNVALTMGVTMLGALESGKEVPGALASMIMNAMEELVAEETEIKVSDNKVAGKVNKVADAARELAEAYGRKVTIDEIISETGMSRKSVVDAVNMTGNKIDDIEVEQ